MMKSKKCKPVAYLHSEYVGLMMNPFGTREVWIELNTIEPDRVVFNVWPCKFPKSKKVTVIENENPTNPERYKFDLPQEIQEQLKERLANNLSDNDPWPGWFPLELSWNRSSPLIFEKELKKGGGR